MEKLIKVVFPSTPFQVLVQRQYFNRNFHWKRCTLYLIKYGLILCTTKDYNKSYCQREAVHQLQPNNCLWGILVSLHRNKCVSVLSILFLVYIDSWFGLTGYRWVEFWWRIVPTFSGQSSPADDALQLPLGDDLDQLPEYKPTYQPEKVVYFCNDPHNCPKCDLNIKVLTYKYL